MKEQNGRVPRDFRLELRDSHHSLPSAESAEEISPIYGPVRDCELTVDLGKMQVYCPRAYQIEPGDL